MDLQTGRGDGPRRRRARRFEAGRIQLQGSIRVPGRVVDLLDAARRECVAVKCASKAHFRRKDASKTATRLKMREKPPVDLKRCRGNARETATQQEATPRGRAGRPDVYEKPPLDLKRCRGNARKAATCLRALSLASRGRCIPLATSSFGASRGAVEGAKSRRRGGLRNRDTQPMVPAHEKGREPTRPAPLQNEMLDGAPPWSTSQAR